MKKIHKPQNIILGIIAFGLAVYIFYNVDNGTWKYIGIGFFIIIGIVSINEAFDPTKPSDLEFDPSGKNKFLECQNCHHRENFINLNIRKESKIYASDEYEIAKKGNDDLHKYLLLCLKCKYVSLWAEYSPPKNYPEYFECFRINEKYKNKFIKSSTKFKHTEKTDLIKKLKINEKK